MQPSRTEELRQSWRDWSAHLYDTYVFQEKGNVWTPYKVENVSVAGLSGDEEEDIPEDDQYSLEEITLLIRGVSGGRKVKKAVLGNSVSLKFPELGMSDGLGEHEAGFSYYYGIRQFKKSFSPRVARTDIVSKVSPLYWERPVSRVDESLTAALAALDQIMNKNYSDVFDSYEELMALNKCSAALSSNFAIASSLYSKYPILVYKDTDVGILREGVAEIPSGFAGLIEEYETEVSKEVTIK